MVLSDGLQRLERSPTQVPQVRQVSHHLHTHRSNSASFHPVLVLSSLSLPPPPPPAFMKHLCVLNIMVCHIYTGLCTKRLTGVKLCSFVLPLQSIPNMLRHLLLMRDAIQIQFDSSSVQNTLLSIAITKI